MLAEIFRLHGADQHRKRLLNPRLQLVEAQAPAQEEANPMEEYPA
jgi:hypothetical protein